MADAETQTEREDKYEVGTAFVLPDLGELAARIESVELELLSVYFDTPAHDLMNSKVTLRRRSGDNDNGWHAKLPAGSARTEVRLPLTDGDEVPEELLALTLGLRRGRPLRRVATLSTRRRATRLFAEDGGLIAEIADDHVRATATGPSAVASQWREVEVELGPAGDEAVLAKIGKRLVKAGASASSSASKLGRALTPLKPVVASQRRTVGTLVLAYQAEQLTALLDGDLALRQHQEVVHPTRVATRRFRSTLRTFGDLFDADRAERLDEELAWYAGVLGEVRDREVLAKHLAVAAQTLPVQLVPEVVASDIANRLETERAAGLATVHNELSGVRYLDLLAALDEWFAEPPLTQRGGGPPSSVRHWIKRAETKVAKRLKRGLHDNDDEALHSARKSAKRARYAAELAGPVLGSKTAKRKVKTYTDLQDVLGEHQDSIVAAQWLLANGAGVPASETIPTIHRFAYGLLYAREVQRSASATDIARRKLR